MNKLEYNKCRAIITRLKTDSESIKMHEIDFLKSFPQSEVEEIIRELTGTIAGNNGQGNWNPNNGNIRSGKFYGKD